MNENGEYPLRSGWAWTTLGEVTSPRGLRIRPSDLPGAPFIGMQHVEPHTMRLIGQGAAKDMRSSGAYFRDGDVLYGRLRPYLNKVYRAQFEGIASAEFIVLPAHPHLDNRFLQFFLNSAAFVEFTTRETTGDRPRVDFTQLASHPFPLAPLAEQNRIVAVIEQQFTRLDSAVAALKRARANLKRYRSSILNAACDGSLVPTVTAPLPVLPHDSPSIIH